MRFGQQILIADSFMADPKMYPGVLNRMFLLIVEFLADAHFVIVIIPCVLAFCAMNSVYLIRRIVGSITRPYFYPRLIHDIEDRSF